MVLLNQLTDAQLVSNYQQNLDPIYFGELYNRYFKKVYHYCLGKVKDREHAYDITADTFLKLTKKIINLRNPDLFIAWLFKIANNACIDCLKAKGRTYSVETNTFFDLEDDDSDLEKAIDKEEQLNKLEEILKDLDEDTKSLLIEKYFNGKSVEDLQEEMGLSKSAVKMRLARGRNKIADLFQNKKIA